MCRYLTAAGASPCPTTKDCRECRPLQVQIEPYGYRGWRPRQPVKSYCTSLSIIHYLFQPPPSKSEILPPPPREAIRRPFGELSAQLTEGEIMREWINGYCEKEYNKFSASSTQLRIFNRDTPNIKTGDSQSPLPHQVHKKISGRSDGRPLLNYTILNLILGFSSAISLKTATSISA